MRTNLPKIIKHNESGIVNLDSFEGKGTHWTAYVKHGSVIKYFDSFGNLKPPFELIKYFNSNSARSKRPITILYNHDRYQKFNAVNCGHLCLKFLYKTYNL